MLLVDVYPTLCEAAGLPIPAHCDGRSLLPLLEDPQQAGAPIACSQLRRRGVIGRSLRTARYRFTIWEKDGDTEAIELYDLETDPQGNVNLAGSAEHAELVESMTRLHRNSWPRD